MNIHALIVMLALTLTAHVASAGETGDHAAKPAAMEAVTDTATKATGAGITTPSGLQYEVMREGSGTPPLARDTVTIAFRGFLLDGREFDSSERRHTTQTFPLHRVIPGWTEGIQLMNEKAKYRFTVPANLAYGATGAPSMVPPVPPDATLVFEIELLKIARWGYGEKSAAATAK